jgi:hypothetical protein
MDIGKWKILAVSMTLICSLAIPVLAYTIYRTPLYPLSAGIILQGPTMQLGFYWNGECTDPATIIDFGEIVVSSSPTYFEKIIFIRNEGNSTTTVFWNSTLSTMTTAITEEWTRFSLMPPYPTLNATTVAPGEVVQTFYSIDIQASPPVGTYNWTLTVWGETYI